jgi:hypothetical protein
LKIQKLLYQVILKAISKVHPLKFRKIIFDTSIVKERKDHKLENHIITNDWQKNANKEPGPILEN